MIAKLVATYTKRKTHRYWLLYLAIFNAYRPYYKIQKMWKNDCFYQQRT